jgi:hypothetical protein
LILLTICGISSSMKLRTMILGISATGVIAAGVYTTSLVNAISTTEDSVQAANTQPVVLVKAEVKPIIEPEIAPVVEQVESTPVQIEPEPIQEPLSLRDQAANVYLVKWRGLSELQQDRIRGCFDGAVIKIEQRGTSFGGWANETHIMQLADYFATLDWIPCGSSGFQYTSLAAIFLEKNPF